MNKTKKRNTVISLFLVAAMALGGMYAFLTAQDSVTNTFTVGKIDIELWEDFDGNEYGPDDGDPPTLSLVVPTQKIEKAPYIKNTGDNDAYVFMEIGVPVENLILQDENGDFLNNGEPTLSEIFKILDSSDNEGFNRTTEVVDDAEVDTGWTYVSTKENVVDEDGKTYNYYLYFYNTVLAPDEQTTTLFDNIVTANYYAGSKGGVDRVVFGNGDGEFNDVDSMDDVIDLDPLTAYKFHDALDFRSVDAKGISVKIEVDGQFEDYFELETEALNDELAEDAGTSAIVVERKMNTFDSGSAGSIYGIETNALPDNDSYRTASELAVMFDYVFGENNWDAIIVEQKTTVDTEQLIADWSADPAATKDILGLDTIPTAEEIEEAAEGTATLVTTDTDYNNFGVLFINIRNDVLNDPDDETAGTYCKSGVYSWIMDTEGDVLEMAPFMHSLAINQRMAVDFPADPVDIEGVPSDEERTIPINAYAIQTGVEQTVYDETDVSKSTSDVESEAVAYTADIKYDGIVDGLFRYSNSVEDLNDFNASIGWIPFTTMDVPGQLISKVEGLSSDDYQIGYAEDQKYCDPDFKTGNYSDKHVSAINVKSNNTVVDLGDGWVLTLNEGLYISGFSSLTSSTKADGNTVQFLFNDIDYPWGEDGTILVLANGMLVDDSDYQIISTDDPVLITFNQAPEKGTLLTLVCTSNDGLTMKPNNANRENAHRDTDYGFYYETIIDYSDAIDVDCNQNLGEVTIPTYNYETFSCFDSSFTLSDLTNSSSFKPYETGSNIYVESDVTEDGDINYIISIGNNTFHDVTLTPGLWVKYGYGVEMDFNTWQRVRKMPSFTTKEIDPSIKSTTVSVPSTDVPISTGDNDTYRKLSSSIDATDLEGITCTYDIYNGDTLIVTYNLASLMPTYVEKSSALQYITTEEMPAPIINSIGNNTFNGVNLSDGLYFQVTAFEEYDLVPTGIRYGASSIEIEDDIPAAQQNISNAIWARTFDDEDKMFDVKMTDWLVRVCDGLSDEELATLEFDYSRNGYTLDETGARINEGETAVFCCVKTSGYDNYLEGSVINVPVAGIYNIHCASDRKGGSYGYAFERYKTVYLEQGLYIVSPSDSEAEFSYSYKEMSPQTVELTKNQPLSIWAAIAGQHDTIDYITE